MKKEWNNVKIEALNIEATKNEIPQDKSIDDWTTNGFPVTDGKTGWGYADKGSGTGTSHDFDVWNK